MSKADPPPTFAERCGERGKKERDDSWAVCLKTPFPLPPSICCCFSSSSFASGLAIRRGLNSRSLLVLIVALVVGPIVDASFLCVLSSWNIIFCEQVRTLLIGRLILFSSRPFFYRHFSPPPTPPAFIRPTRREDGGATSTTVDLR